MNDPTNRPVFYDPSGQRRRWTRRGIFLLFLLLVIAAVGFASTVVSIPAPSPLPLGFERPTPLPFRAQVGRLSRGIASLFAPAPKQHPGTRGRHPITIGFYPTWADDPAPSLVKHIGQLDWVVPTTLAIAPDGKLKVTEDKTLRRILLNNLHHPLVVPMVQNLIGDAFSGDATVALLRDPARQKLFIAALESYLDVHNDAGVTFDFENIPTALIPNYRALIAATNADFDKRGRIVAVTVLLDSPDWSPRAFAAVADKIILMAYDQHYEGGEPGPIAANDWFAAKVANAIKDVPPDKLIVALGSYAYHWHDGKADGITVEEAWLAAHDAGATPTFDRATGNTAFSFMDAGKRHDIWMLDAAASWNQMHMLSRLGASSIALWRMGSEDPGFWPALSSWRGEQAGGGPKPFAPPDLTAIAQDTNVDVEDEGEIIRITATPTPGERQVDFDPRSHAITGERYIRLPTPFVVQRIGARAKEVALTFDDGPDNVWTPQILSILEQYHVPATFFVIGENGVANRGLLERMVRDGDEIGNHTYTHPNLSGESGTGVDLQLNATRRLVEAYTGKSIRLFRAPYFGDAEPTTPDELTPALIAQDHGYTIVGLHVDPGDWTRPGAQAIVDRTLQQVAAASPDRSANIVLLHDAGGDRAQTIAALPAIIVGLQKAGYRIVPVSTLAGLTHAQVMPDLAGVDLASVRADVYAFTAIGLTIAALNWTFFFAIALGVVRAVTLAGLALLPPRFKRPAPDPGFEPTVSVIIPAYNEERVIESSIRRILDSSYAKIEVIVADDGSKDRTSAIVRDAFGDNPRVRLMTMVNGGKANALNRALAVAQGEIIVALDADTQFERETISLLIRWFIRPRIGAVAGNAKVGNRINLVTRWQAVEYVTAQNIERKALTRFDAIMVVPGAVGAWRRTALEDVGLYPEDTLAEDQDLTINIQRHGWRVAYDDEAVAWTEAPETFRSLSKQRFRWSFGTLQCLWKHAGIWTRGRPSGLAFIGMPQAWLFQIIFAVISPAIDLALVVSIVGTIVRVAQHGWAQTQTDVLRMGAYWLSFTAIDVVCGWIGYRLDEREKRFPALLLLAQRFVYRQLMYSVVIRAVSAATRGVGIGWGKLERSGSVTAPGLVAVGGVPGGDDTERRIADRRAAERRGSEGAEPPGRR